MPTIASLTERTAPLTGESRGVDAFRRFADDRDALLLAVIQDGRPIGVVERDSFLLRFGGPNGHALYGYRPVTFVMDADPVVVEASVDIATFCDSMLTGRASSLTRGFVVTDQGRYVGVATVLSLLQATSVSSRHRAESLADTIARSDQSQGLAKESARSTSAFLSVISHALRTPMNGVLAVAELLQRQPLGPDAQAYVQTIIDSSDTLLRVLQDSVDHARAEAGELTITPAAGSLREMMDQVHAAWTPRAAQDGVSLLVSYDGDPDLAAEYDAARVRQVFDNLIANALQYARNGVVEARLRATVSGPDVRLEASVRDNGQKLRADELVHLFDAFSAHRSASTGTGLGLSICRQVVQAMGGEISAQSNAGKGATFTFCLHAPRAWLDQPEQSNVSELSDLQLHTQPHVLIVDDNATNRVVAQALCEMFGCTSECAEDGLEAVEAVKGRRFDLVLMDIKMPRMDGVQATRTIRALPGAESDVPIIALTANADPDDARHYVSIGMAAVVEKPIKPERLRAAMNAALEPVSAAQEPAAPSARATG